MTPYTLDSLAFRMQYFPYLKKITLLFLTLFIGTIATAQKHTISGYIKDASNGEALIGANVYVKEIASGTVTNTYGFYSITLEEGAYNLTFSYLGFDDIEKPLSLKENIKLEIELGTSSVMIEEVVISAKKEDLDANVESAEMSKVELDIETIQKMPALMGEVDIIKAIQLLPGVATVGEGTSGFYVRGGNVDQNLVLLDEAPVYNASHLLGFFSVFNPDAIKDMQLYKGAMPAEFGGRLSSVVDIQMKEGNSKEFDAKAGIGSVSSRLTLESPLGENGSVMVSGRRTYVDLFLGLSKDSTINENKLFFHDLNAKMNFTLSEKDRLYLSAYTGRDAFKQGSQFNTDWGNTTTTLRWNHLFSPKLFSNLTAYFSDYNYLLSAQEEDSFEFKWTSDLKDYGLKYDFGFYASPSSTIKFGVQSILHNIKPGIAKATSATEIELGTLEVENTRSLENAIYVAHELSIGDALKVNYGARVSGILNLGPGDVFTYNENFKVRDTTTYTKNEVYNTYYNFEPRFGLKYSLGNSSSIKASYNRTAQYIQLASNSTSSSPLDVWFPSSPTVQPQTANQYAVGFFKNFQDNAIEASAELYYKNFSNSIDFKDNAQLLLNPKLEGELRFGEARAYGLELFLQKNVGKLTGWVSYTLSKSEKKIDGINNGNWYNAKYDKTHDFAVVASYDINDRWNVSGNFIFATGSAVTFPTGKFNHLGRSIPIYSERNAERMPAYHRMDISATWNLKKKWFKKGDQSLLFSVYNVYARKNAFSINFKEDPENADQTIAEKTYLFGILPSVTWNVEF